MRCPFCQQDHDRVLLAAEAALHERESRVHEEHEERREEHPHGVQQSLSYALFHRKPLWSPEGEEEVATRRDAD